MCSSDLRKSNGAPAESSAGPSSESNARLPARRDNVPPSLPPPENPAPRTLPPASSIGTMTFSSGAAVLDAVRRQHNRLIVAEAGQERRRTLATVRDFLPPFGFEEMRESILETVGHVPMVGPKGGLYRGWDSHRDEILLVFQSMRTSCHLRNLFIRPHYQLMLRLVENYIDNIGWCHKEAVWLGDSKTVLASSITSEFVRFVESFPDRLSAVLCDTNDVSGEPVALSPLLQHEPMEKSHSGNKYGTTKRVVAQ